MWQVYWALLVINMVNQLSTNEMVIFQDVNLWKHNVQYN